MKDNAKPCVIPDILHLRRYNFVIENILKITKSVRLYFYLLVKVQT